MDCSNCCAACHEHGNTGVGSSRHHHGSTTLLVVLCHIEGQGAAGSHGSLKAIVILH